MGVRVTAGGRIETVMLLVILPGIQVAVKVVFVVKEPEFALELICNKNL